MVRRVQLGNIDDDLINALRYNDYTWIKKMVGKGIIRVLPEEEIGSKRCCDLLVSILNYGARGTQKVSIEVENDREFDASAILRKIKKAQPYPTVVIIPHNKAKDSWRFQESMIKVWYWKAKIEWKCKKCNASFITTSSIMPFKCEKCGNAQFEYARAKPEDIDFAEDDNNPTMTFGDIQDKLDQGHSSQSDLEALKLFRSFMDRPALHQPFHLEGNMHDFLVALDDIIRALNTGILKTREGDEIARTKSRSMFSNPNWRKTLETLTMRFEELRTRFQLAVRNKEMILRLDNGFYAFNNHRLPLEIDTKRESIALLFNELLKEAGLEPIRSVHDFDFRRRWSMYHDSAF